MLQNADLAREFKAKFEECQEKLRQSRCFSEFLTGFFCFVLLASHFAINAKCVCVHVHVHTCIHVHVYVLYRFTETQDVDGWRLRFCY